MTLKIPSNRTIFGEFEHAYLSVLLPYLEERESKRRLVISKFGVILVITAVAALALVFFGPFGEGNYQAAMFSAIAGVGSAFFLLNRTRREISDGLLGRIADVFGFAYQNDIQVPEYVPAFQGFKILPHYHKGDYEDEVSGIYNGVTFSFCEAHLRRRSSGKNRSYRTVFHGQIFVIDYEKKFLGKTVLQRDAGILNRLGKPGREFQQVGLASPAFEKVFEAWSTDQVEAREILDPIVLERFEELERLFKGGQLSAAFSGGQVMISLHVGDKLNMGSMFTPLTTPDRVEKILEEFDLVFDLIDVLTKQTDGKMSGAYSIDEVRTRSLS